MSFLIQSWCLTYPNLIKFLKHHFYLSVIRENGRTTMPLGRFGVELLRPVEKIGLRGISVLVSSRAVLLNSFSDSFTSVSRTCSIDAVPLTVLEYKWNRVNNKEIYWETCWMWLVKILPRILKWTTVNSRYCFWQPLSELVRPSGVVSDIVYSFSLLY